MKIIIANDYEDMSRKAANYLIHYYSSPSLLTNKLFFITDKLAFDEQITYLCVIANYK